MNPLEILARIGSDEPPTLDELRAARDELARQLHQLRRDGVDDLEALTSLRDAYNLASSAVDEGEQAEAESVQTVDEILDGVDDPDADADEDEGGDGPPRVLSVVEAAARLGLTPAAGPAPDTLATTTHTVVVGDQVRNELTWHDLGHEFASAAKSVKPGKTKLARIETQFDPARTLPGDKAGNTRLIDSIVAPEAVAAAGGCCALPTPIYDNPVLASAARPIRDSLPSFGASRGSVTFFPAICLPDSGADVWTCADDAAVDPDDPDTWKDCLEVVCDDAETVNVDAIFRCLTVGNFQQRFAPEQWESTIRAVVARQARRAETNLFDAMRACVDTTHTGASSGSVYANLLNDVALAAATIRQDQRYIDVDLVLWIGAWMLPAIATDARNRRLPNVDMVENTRELVATALGNEGVRPVYTWDVDLILAGDQTSGALESFPDTASAVLAAEGTFTFLDGGEFNLGTEIRDHDLNRQNSVAAFAESFEALMCRGCGSKALDIDVEICADAQGCA